MTTRPAQKYQNLVTAAAAGVLVPPCLHLSAAEVTSQSYSEKVAAFMSLYPASRYIVRSAVALEDGAECSYAGYFYSSAPVPGNMVTVTVVSVMKENEERARVVTDQPEVGVLLMPFIEAVYGGVAASPWLYFYDHALVEWAESPQAAVAGRSVTAGLLARSSDTGHSSAIGALPKTLISALATSIDTLHRTFTFPLDIEWAFDGNQLYILQVRPITIAPSAVAVIATPPPPPYQYTVYGESLGKLSPRSFALLNYLFANAHAYWEQTQIVGGASFLARVETGNILTDQVQARSYFTPQHWYSPFTRALRTRQTLADLAEQAAAFVAPDEVNLAATQIAFSAWQTAVTLEALVGITSGRYARPFEYELTQPCDLAQYPTTTTVAVWKKHFLTSLVPWREQVFKNPVLAWSTNLFSDVSLLQPDVTDELDASLQTYVGIAHTGSPNRLWGTSVTAPAQVITQPGAWTEPLPTDRIVVTPYIPAPWISQLPNLTGIMVVSISTLSHAAIVLREHNVPTAHIAEALLQATTTGDRVTL